MAKLTTSTLSNLNNQASAVATINANMTAIEEAIENTLSRDGTSPNQMQSNLDMNDYRITNIGTAVDDDDLLTLGGAEEVFEEIFTENYEAIIASIISDEQKGWAPVLAVVEDGVRSVLEVVDWTGGGGDKPTDLGYIGEEGLVELIGDAVNVRGETGASGAGSGDLLASNNLSDLENARLGRDNLGFVTTTTDEAIVRFDGTTGNTQDTTTTLSDAGVFTIPETTTPATPSTSQIKIYAKSDTLNILDGAGTERAITKMAVDYQAFTSSGTWTKPSGFSATGIAIIEAWGAGGGSGNASGGGGGAYVREIVPLSSLASTVAVTVGTSAAGVAGGNSSFGTHVVAYGGGGGQTSYSKGGGGGGGSVTAGSTATNSSGADGGVAGGGGGGAGAGGVGGVGSGDGQDGSDASSSSGGHGGRSYKGGGGGGGSSGSSGTNIGGNGGNSVWGGAGGAALGEDVNGSAGTSTHGGNGGAYGAVGAVRGGGAGAGGASGLAGGRGEVRVRVIG